MDRAPYKTAKEEGEGGILSILQCSVHIQLPVTWSPKKMYNGDTSGFEVKAWQQEQYHVIMYMV